MAIFQKKNVVTYKELFSDARKLKKNLDDDALKHRIRQILYKEKSYGRIKRIDKGKYRLVKY